MADNTPVGSLSEFLAKRAAMKSASDAPAQVTQAPTPQSESPAVPGKVAKPPASVTYAPKYKPSFLRSSLGAVANEALGGSGHAGRILAKRIAGDHLINRGYTRVITPSNASDEAVDLSSPGKAPSDVNIGIARSVQDIESQVVRIDREVKDWGKYVTNEFVAVRKDIHGVLEVTKKTQSDVDRMKKDLAEETFRKRVVESKIRNKSGQLMSADQLQKNPYAVHPDQQSLAGELIKELEAWAMGGASVAGIGVLSKLKRALTGIGRGGEDAVAKTGARVGSEAAAETGARAAGSVSKGVDAAEGAARGSKYLRGAGKALGAVAGAPLDVAVIGGMTSGEEDDELKDGKDKWTKLHSKYSQETIDAARKKYQPWYQFGGGYANENEEWIKKYLSEQKGVSQGTSQVSPEGSGKESDSDVVISSKKDVSIHSVLDISIEARNELTLKARVITLDADRLELKGNIKDLGGIGQENTGHTEDTTTRLNAGQMRLQKLIEQNGPQKGQEMYDAESPSSFFDKINPFSSRRNSSGSDSGGSTKKGREGDAERQPDETPNGSLASQREKFSQEIQNTPGLYEKILRIAANEQGKNGQGTQAVIESMMNRAIVRGTTLEKQARWHTSENGYYEEGNMGRGALEDPKWKEVLEGSYKKALSGSNISKYATDNASGNLAAREQADGSFRYASDFNGETMFAPGTAEQNLAKKWDKWRQNTEEAEARNRQEKSQESTAAPDGAKVGGGKFVGSTTAPGVDRRIQEIVAAAAAHLPDGYKVGMTSGFRGMNTPNHNGHAADFHIIRPDGSVIQNRGEDPTGMYTKLAQHAYGEMLSRYPGLKGKFAWGGAFGTQLGGGGQRDLMHFDINGERGRYTDWQLHNLGAIKGEKYGEDFASTMSRDAPPKDSDTPKDQTRFPSDVKDAKAVELPPVTVDAPDTGGQSIDQDASKSLESAFKRVDENRADSAMSLELPDNSNVGRGVDSDASDGLEAAFDRVNRQKSDAEVAKTDFSRAVPQPDTTTQSGEEITQQIGDQVARENASKAPTPEAKPNSTASIGSGGNANEKISAPRHHPESEAPRPGSDGYGDQQHNPDDCGICSLA